MSMLILGDAAQLCLPPDSPADTIVCALSLEMKRIVTKPYSAHRFWSLLGFQTSVSQQEEYSPNAFLEINAFPHAFHSLCQHSCA